MRNSLKSGPGTWDLAPPETREPGSGTLGHGPLPPRTWNWDPDTQDPGTGSVELGTCDPETQNPESRTVRIELVTQTPSIPTSTTD